MHASLLQYAIVIGINGLLSKSLLLFTLLIKVQSTFLLAALDAGVVVGLSIGVLSMLYWLLQEYKQLAYLHSPEVPQPS